MSELLKERTGTISEVIEVLMELYHTRDPVIHYTFMFLFVALVIPLVGGILFIIWDAFFGPSAEDTVSKKKKQE